MEHLLVLLALESLLASKPVLAGTCSGGRYKSNITKKTLLSLTGLARVRNVEGLCAAAGVATASLCNNISICYSCSHCMDNSQLLGQIPVTSRPLSTRGVSRYVKSSVMLSDTHSWYA